MKELRLTASGMVTPLGMNTGATAAAVRAGLARCFAADTGEVVTSTVRGLTDDLRGSARVEALLAGALTALGEKLEQEGRDRSLDALLGADDSALVIALPTRYEKTITTSSCRALVDSMAGFATLPQHTSLAFGSRTIAWKGLTEIWSKLSEGKLRRVFVWTADCLADPDAVHSKDSQIKRLGEADGFTAGEAGAAVLLEIDKGDSSALAIRAGRPQLATEENEPGADEVQSGTALGKALTTALDSLGLDAPWVLSDLNGETWRFEEFGNALCRYDARKDKTGSGAERKVWHPADCLGDLGIATPIVAMALTGRALERGYAPHDSALLLMGDKGASRGAMTIRATTRQGS